jgi:hypothetical protein
MLGHTKSPVANDNDSRYDSHQQMTMIKDKKNVDDMQERFDCIARV